jgi:hypothetical protein
VALDGAGLVIKRRPDTVLRMRVNELSIKLDRVWDLRFERMP